MPTNSNSQPAANLPPPQHVAVVMDGNGRWARRRGLPRAAGHRRGVEAVKNLTPVFCRRGIPYLTLFAFSSENWRRPRGEVTMLLELLASTLEKEIGLLHENQIRLRVIGDLTRLPTRLQRKIAAAVDATAHYRAHNLSIAVNYGGRWDIAQAARRLAASAAAGEADAAAIDEDTLESYLCTAALPSPDLFIRTGGERRISNFLLWQLAYTELYFTDVFWPDFDEREFDRALAEFAGRQRRFGRTGEQVALTPP